ncbi:MAG: imidazole glycerol phosphate synthase subunit HisH [Spirochaetales bacterium]
MNADKILFPGVGNAKYAMQELAKSGFDSFLHDCVAAQTPVLGICLGSQIIFDYSEEGDVACLGIIKGKIRHFSNLLQKENHSVLKIPHMGWNGIEFAKSSVLFTGIPENSDFYFVHSYVIQPENPDIVCAYSDYGMSFPAAIQQNNVFACQFHPEKSGFLGLKILENFAGMSSRQITEASC